MDVFVTMSIESSSLKLFISMCALTYMIVINYLTKRSISDLLANDVIALVALMIIWIGLLLIQMQLFVILIKRESLTFSYKAIFYLMVASAIGSLAYVITLAYHIANLIVS